MIVNDTLYTPEGTYNLQSSDPTLIPHTACIENVISDIAVVDYSAKGVPLHRYRDGNGGSMEKGYIYELDGHKTKLPTNVSCDGLSPDGRYILLRRKRRNANWEHAPKSPQYTTTILDRFLGIEHQLQGEALDNPIFYSDGKCLLGHTATHIFSYDIPEHDVGAKLNGRSLRYRRKVSVFTGETFIEAICMGNEGKEAFVVVNNNLGRIDLESMSWVECPSEEA